MSSEKDDILGINKTEAKQAFKTPNNYFEELPSTILQKASESVRIVKFPNKTRWQIAASVAAIFAIACILVFKFNSNKNTPQQASMSKDDIYEVLLKESDNFSNTDDMLLEDALDINTLAATELKDTVKLDIEKKHTNIKDNAHSSSITKEDIIEYLSEYETDNE